MNDENLKFWQVVKKKAGLILVVDFVLSFITVKVIDFILNWYLNRETAAYGVYYNFTISIFSPIFFVIFFIIVTNIMKKHMNKDAGQKQGIQFKYNRGYTWRDIYRDRESFAFFLITAFGIFTLLYYGTRWIGGLSSNYAIASFESISIDMLVLISAILAIFVVVFLQNTVIAWLIKTEKGNKILGILVFIFGIITAFAMSGISYLWTSADELETSIQDDFAMSIIIPFDMPTMLFGLITIWFAVKARTYAKAQKKMIRTGVIIAVISVIISFTPLQMIIQGIFISFRWLMGEL